MIEEGRPKVDFTDIDTLQQLIDTSEVIKPTVYSRHKGHIFAECMCGNLKLNPSMHFCPECGRELDWEGVA
jgi:hypothetical protein